MEGARSRRREVAGREGDLLCRMRDQAELLAEVFQNGWRLRELEPRSRVAGSAAQSAWASWRERRDAPGYAAMISGIPSPCIVYFTSAAAKTSLTNSARPRRLGTAGARSPTCLLHFALCFCSSDLPRPPDQRIPGSPACRGIWARGHEYCAATLLYLDERWQHPSYATSKSVLADCKVTSNSVQPGRGPGGGGARGTATERTSLSLDCARGLHRVAAGSEKPGPSTAQCCDFSSHTRPVEETQRGELPRRRRRRPPTIAAAAPTPTFGEAARRGQQRRVDAVEAPCDALEPSERDGEPARRPASHVADGASRRLRRCTRGRRPYPRAPRQDTVLQRLDDGAASADGYDAPAAA